MVFLARPVSVWYNTNRSSNVTAKQAKKREEKTMRLSVNERSYSRRPDGSRRTRRETLELAKAGGFDTVDFGLSSMERDCDDTGDHRAWIFAQREICDRLGLKVNQTHAPFFEGRPMPEGFRERLLECVEDSAILGADCMVVHADTWYEADYVQWDYPQVVQAVYEVYAPVVELAAKRGVKLAMETLHEWLGGLYHRMRLCSQIEELDEIVGRFPSDVVGVCWDFGHAAMVYKADQFKVMRRLQSKIIATHVHDNYIRHDDHAMPYQGSICWDEGMRTMAELGYAGDLTLEVNSGALPDGLLLPSARYAREVIGDLAARFAAYQK